MRIWDQMITERDKQVYKLAGFGDRDEFGKTPALVIIDVNYNFVGDKPEALLESVKKFPHSCGEEGWIAVGKIRELLDVARPVNVPIYYTTGYRVDEKRSIGFLAGAGRRAYCFVRPRHSGCGM